MQWLHRLKARLRKLFSRKYHIEMNGSIPPHGRLVLQKIPTDATEAIRVVDSQKRSSSIDLSADGTLSSKIDGPSPQGESDTLDVCKTLVSKLNLMGGHWSDPVRPEGRETGIDCISKDADHKLNIQVTRAMSDQHIWRQLNQTRTATFITTSENAADQLLECAVRKSQKVSREQRADTILAIDAMDVASYTLPEVKDNFRLRHGCTLQEIGFKEVWVVGPTENLTWRLDLQNKT